MEGLRKIPRGILERFPREISEKIPDETRVIVPRKKKLWKNSLLNSGKILLVKFRKISRNIPRTITGRTLGGITNIIPRKKSGEKKSKS